MSDNHGKLQLAEKKMILIVDDEIINREILGAMLGDEYETSFATNGREAIAQMRRYSDTLALVLLDLMMPVMSGMVALKQISEDPELSRIPVMVMTADQESEVACLELGAIDFIPKPYPRRDIVLARVRRTIELSEGRRIIRSTERDPLTGLYNRDYFYSYAESFDQHHKGLSMDAIVVDINHFHLLNERYGRAYADQVLRQIGERLREMVRDSAGIVCRREADTFMVYCPHREDYKAILDYASVGLGDENAVSRVRLRMGVYPKADKAMDMEQRFDRAKTAADAARSNYTQNISMYDNRLHEAELFAEQLIEDFDAAIREGQFKVFYQPKFDIRPEKPVLASAEALVRWQHPRLGLVSPGTFVPLFEGNGMIQKLDNYVWAEAAAQVRRWKEQYGVSVPVSVNVSRVDMFDSGLIATFERLLKDNDLRPEELLLEITESAYTDDAEFIISTVNALRGLGLKVEMDDFGTGYSSLGMISHLPIDALKLDMVFVRNAFDGQGDARMLELIIDIADYLGVPVIAEGVEKKEQVDALKAMGCDIVQGYYFSKPVPPEAFAVFVQEKQRALESASAANPEGGSVGGSAEDAGEPDIAGVDSAASGKRDAARWADVAPNPAGSDAAAGTDDDGRRPAVGVSGIHSQTQRKLENVTYAGIAEALAADYFSIYYVDTNTDRFIEYSSHEEYETLNIDKKGEDFFNASRANVLRVMYPDDQKAFLEVFTKENLMRELDRNGTFTINYRLVFDGAPTWVSMKATRMTDRNDPHIVIGVNNIDSQIQRQEEYEKTHQQSLTYSRIAQALSKDYYSIYLVNVENDEFVEYSSSEAYQDLHVEQNGVNFFEDCRRNVIRLVHPDDLKKALSVWEKDRLMAELRDGHSFSVTYRLMFDDAPVYINCKVIRLSDDEVNRYIVIGVSNVDEQVKRDQAYAYDLKRAKNAALRDALTGVKSKLAFAETESEINASIEQRRQGAFAVVVCDVNGLKTVNDTQGHKAGDEYIKSACAVICNQFKHSPVFRVGGDEFVAVLQGGDYQRRDELVARFDELNAASLQDGGVVIACGMSEWNADGDANFGAVFDRADAAMYENKKNLKA